MTEGMQRVSLPFFGIRVVDGETGRGVPLVELRTTGDVSLVTDSAGWAAFCEPELMGGAVWFSVSSHGYALPPDGFGFRGVKLVPHAGESAVVKISRTNIAERLYRVTGEGIYRDSELLGLRKPGRKRLPGRVIGQDTVFAVPYKGKLYWFWGDTNRPEYPLGQFHTSGATSPLGADPEAGIDLTYFADETGFSRAMLPMQAPGPVWIGGLAAIESGAKLICFWTRVDSKMDALERGLALFDDAKKVFVPVCRFDPKLPAPLTGHPFLYEMEGRSWLVGSRGGSDPLPCVRVEPTLAAMIDPARYEVFTGRGWERGGRPAPLILTDRETGKPIAPHGGSVFYNAYLKRWVMLVLESFGKSSNVGELWFSTSDRPTGPFQPAVKIVSHDKMDFYNPTQHPYFDRGKYIYFEGTYVNTFSGNPTPTPRYNYNQILYRLDLDDPRLRGPA